jgi:DNA repair exonuclease SbcCD ATPase subunit
VDTSIDYLNEAESIFDDMLVTMSESPVSNVYKPVPSSNVQASPSFDVDETRAEDQAELTEDLREEIEKLDQQFRESISAVEVNLMDMHGLLTAKFEDAADPMSKQTVIPGVNTLANQYAYVLTLMERYYALEANKRWLEWEWANDLRSTVQSQSSTIQSGIQTLNNSFNSDLANHISSGYSINYRDEVYRVTQRSHAILRFSNEDLLTFIQVLLIHQHPMISRLLTPH